MATLLLASWCMTFPAAFTEAFAYLLVDEGSVFVDDPIDRGGATRYGITLASLSNYRGKPQTPADVRNLTVDEARQFYLDTYWHPLHLDSVRDTSTRHALFDVAVLVGPRAASRFARAAAGISPDVGTLTDAEVRLIDALPNQGGFVLRFAFTLQAYLGRIVVRDPTQARFLGGWLARTQRLILTNTNLFPVTNAVAPLATS